MSLLDKLDYDNLIAGGEYETKPVEIVSGSGIMKRGTVLGRVKYSCPTSGSAGSNTGNGTITLVRAGKNIKIGTYTLTVAAIAGAFGTTPAVTSVVAELDVVNPAGNHIGSVAIDQVNTKTASFGSEEISFLVTTGSTAWIAGDSFTIVVTEGVPNTGSAGSNTGNGTCPVVRGGPRVKRGVYTATCIEAAVSGTHYGKFKVTNPNGDSIGTVYARGQSGTGNGAITELKAGKNKKIGQYLVECTVAASNGGTLKVTNPDGVIIGTVTLPGTSTGHAHFIHDEIQFKIADNTDFIVGDKLNIDILDSDEMAMELLKSSVAFALADSFTVTVTIGEMDHVMCNSDNTDGSQDPDCVLLEDVDATSAAVSAAALSRGQVNERELVFGDDDVIEQHRETLRAVGITCVVASRGEPV